MVLVSGGMVLTAASLLLLGASAKRLVTLQEVRVRLNLPIQEVRRLIEVGDLAPISTENGQPLFKSSDVDRLSSLLDKAL